MKESFVLLKSNRKDKKFMVFDVEKGKIVHFGAKNYSDMTIHKDEERKNRYMDRHRKNENWDKSGMSTAGFWSRWILWNKPTLNKSIRDTEKRFSIKIHQM
jgi:hypothetical protein